MKKSILSCMMLMGLVLFFSSCKDDDNGPSGKFTFDGESFKLSKAFVTLTDQWNNGDDTWYEWQILLTSSGIKYDASEEDYTGKGDAIILFVYTLNDGILPPGTYKYNEETGYCDGIYIDYNTATQQGTVEDLDSQSGLTITITKSGSTYTITVSGGDLNATYKGKITHVIDEQEPA